jgi:ATP-dependent DNA helicase RecQ
MAYGLQDVINLRSMMAQSDADETHKRVENHKLENMLALADLTSCRRQALLRYFGDSLDDPCGNCDNCLTPPQTWDASDAARKAMSCVYRTGQRFGVTYLVDVLLGKASERIVRFGHDKQSTFGIGDELSTSEWRDVFRQLIAKGLLSVDVDGHGSVKLTEEARPVLRSEQSVHLRRLSAKARQKTKARSRAKPRIDIAESDQALWEALRALRKKLSDMAGVPAYIVFNDSTLADMIALKPLDSAQMSDVSGVGSHKLEQYGDEFLEVIRAYTKD